MPFLVAFLVAVSVGTWIYTKLIRSTGGNTKSALTACAIIGLLIFSVVFMLANRYLTS